MTKRWRLGLLGLGVSLLAIFFIARELNITAVREALAAARFVYIVPCVLLLLAGLVARALRWRLLLNNRLPLGRAFHIMNVAYLVNGVLPLRVGELARAFLAWRTQPPIPAMQTAGSIVVERLLDLLAVVMMVALAFAAGPVPGELRSAGLFFGLSGLAGFLVLVFLARQRHLPHRLLDWLVDRVIPLQRWNPAALLDHFLDGLLPLAQARTLMLALFWTAISWLFSVAAGYVLMYTFYDTPSIAATMLYIAAAALAVAVPATVGNIGVYEASIMLALGAFSYGDSRDVAFAFAITVHAVNVITHSFTGIIGFLAEGVSLGQLSSGVREMSEDHAEVEAAPDLQHLGIHEAAD